MEKTFGERLALARRSRQMNQSQLAEAAEMQRTHLSALERGRNAGKRPYPETIEKLAGALGVRPEWLASGAGEMEVAITPATVAGEVPAGGVPASVVIGLLPYLSREERDKLAAEIERQRGLGNE